MQKQWITILLFSFLLPLSIQSQGGRAVVKLSDLFEKKFIWIFKPEYFTVPPASLHDTIRISFDLINDLGKDTEIVYTESLNEWFQFVGIPTDTSFPEIRKISGRYFYSKIPYDYIYFPAQTIRIDSGAIYKCDIKIKGPAFEPATKYVDLLTPQEYQSSLVVQKKYRNTNFSITYFFIGAIAFGFLFFFFLYVKSRYTLFGVYSLFLFIHTLYGLIQIDAYTRLGHFLIRYYNFDDYVNEFLAFSAQAIYVQFLIYWLDIKSNNPKAFKIFYGISIFFLTYAFSMLLLYSINSHLVLIGYMQDWIRIITIFFQFIVFYFLIFKIKSPVKSYVITGSAMMTFFGVILVYFNIHGAFDVGTFAYFDNGSWYMIGVLTESICLPWAWVSGIFRSTRKTFICIRKM